MRIEDHPRASLAVHYATPQGRVSRPSLNGTGAMDDGGVVSCSSCALRDRCLPCGLHAEDVAAISAMVSTQKFVQSGDALYRSGDEFASIYAVLTGCFKSSVGLEDGREQVTGFHMPGEIVGLDGIAGRHHAANVIALEDSEVCVIARAQLEESLMQRQLHKAMSRELVRDHRMMLLLGSMRADERLAAFLLNLSERFLARGLPENEFDLCMTRKEIGSYLGLRIETVSRLFSRFHREGLISVRQRHVRILRTAGLEESASRPRPAPSAPRDRPPGAPSHPPVPRHPR